LHRSLLSLGKLRRKHSSTYNKLFVESKHTEKHQLNLEKIYIALSQHNLYDTVKKEDFSERNNTKVVYT